MTVPAPATRYHMDDTIASQWVFGKVDEGTFEAGDLEDAGVDASLYVVPGAPHFVCVDYADK